MKKFKDLELKFIELRKKAEIGEIDSATVNKELKKLMVLDSKGSYWIIGGNSGKWYKYNGKDWKEDDPYKTDNISQQENLHNTTKVIKNDIKQTQIKNTKTLTQSDTPHIISSIDNKIICKNCKSKIESYEIHCHICGTNQKENLSPKIKKKESDIPELLISSVNLISLMFFFGGIGIIIGVILGATIGIFKDIPIYIELPQMLNDLRSNILGGILFAILGGLAGFLIFAVKAIFFGSLYNLISYFFGGIRFKTKK